MKIKFVLVISLLCISLVSISQNAIFLGINPSVTKEKFYPKGAFDVNILPVTFEAPVIQNLDARLILLMNYGFRSTASALISAGAELCLPYYIHRGGFDDGIPKGFYAGPGLAYTRNIHYGHSNLTAFLEPGYSFVWDDGFSLIIGLQYGQTYFNYDDGTRGQTTHFGVKVILGWWL